MDERSEKSLKGVHPDLVAVMRRAAEQSPVKFKIIEGMRDAKRQAALKKAGKSKVKVSRHQSGHAVDIAALVKGKISWDFPLYPKINEAVQQAARDFGIPVIWGGVWKSLKDGGHFELPAAKYPAGKPHVAKKIIPKPMPKPVLAPVSWFDSLDEKERKKVVEAVQKDLLGHGYVNVGGIDGLVGDRTRSMIRDFRAANDLPPGDHIDKALIEALGRPDAVRPVIAPDRANATLSTLRAKDSKIVKATDWVKAGSAGVAGLGAVKGGHDALTGPEAAPGVGDVLTESGEQVGQVVEMLSPFQTLFAIFMDWIWVPVTIIALVVGWKAFEIGRARLRDHREGNTSMVNLPEQEG